MTRILIVEDEPRIASFLQKGLRAEGFTTMVVEDGIAAAQIARDDAFELMILDLGLPGKTGQEVLSEIRGRGEKLPVIILTARKGVQDTVAGLESGADDYMTKPFSFHEMLARIRARLRDAPTADLTVIEAGSITLDLRTRKVTANGSEFDLSAREFGLAETLMRHPGQVLSREQLLSRVWGYDFDPGSNVVDVYVGYLRRKLGDASIETVRGMGYRFVVP
jgi:DNA-binding response OmpR family regulator